MSQINLITFFSKIANMWHCASKISFYFTFHLKDNDIRLPLQSRLFHIKRYDSVIEHTLNFLQHYISCGKVNVCGI